MILAPASDDLGVRCPPTRALRTDLIDHHFEVREAIGAFMSAPTTAARAEVQRGVHSFLAAEQALLAAERTLADGDETERDAQLLAAPPSAEQRHESTRHPRSSRGASTPLP